MMMAPKMTRALAGILIPGVLATEYAGGQATTTVVTQQIGYTTSDGAIIYSLNCCTIVENTQCQVSLSTVSGGATTVSAYPPPGGETPVVVVSGITVTGETLVTAEPAPTSVVSGTVVSVTEIAPGAPQSTSETSSGPIVTNGQTAPSGISTTTAASILTFVSSSALANTNSAVSSESTTSAEASSTEGRQTNATSSETQGSPSGSMTVPSAPGHTNAGAALQALPAAILGGALLAMVHLF